MNVILITAGILTIASPLSYLYKVSKKEVRPSILSWYGWSALMGISIVSQIAADGWSSDLITIFLSASGCFIIAFCARHIFRHYSVSRKDRIYLYAGGSCVLIYILFSNPWLTTCLAIAADFMLAIPTLKIAYTSPEDEKSFNWPLALLSWLLTFAILLLQFSWINALWPVYLILFNGTMTYFTFIRKKQARSFA